MHHSMKYLPGLFSMGISLCLIVCLAGCSPEDDPQAIDGGSEDNKPTLVTNLNGYQFEGSFKETLEPEYYKFVTIQHLETYNDTIRVFFSSFDDVLVRYHWKVQSRYKGKLNREFSWLTFNDPEDYEFAFNHEDFKLLGYHIPTSNVVTYRKNGESAYYLSKPNNNFPFLFNENYTVFFGNASSIYVHENKQKAYTSPGPTQGYLLTSESSVAWADYLMEDDGVNPYTFREGIYTGFFNATLDKFNYIGIAKGQQTLDTLVINKNNPTLYYPYTDVFMSRTDQKIYLGLIKKKAPSSSNDISVYEMDSNEKIIRPVFKNLDAPNLNNPVFVRGKFYYGTKVLTNTGQLEEMQLPVLTATSSVGKVIFGSTRIFVVVQKGNELAEIYSRSY